VQSEQLRRKGRREDKTNLVRSVGDAHVKVRQLRLDEIADEDVELLLFRPARWRIVNTFFEKAFSAQPPPSTLPHPHHPLRRTSAHPSLNLSLPQVTPLTPSLRPLHRYSTRKSQREKSVSTYLPCTRLLSSAAILGSISTAVQVLHFSRMRTVRLPVPGPISRTTSEGRRLALSTMLERNETEMRLNDDGEVGGSRSKNGGRRGRKGSGAAEGGERDGEGTEGKGQSSATPS
jgi:hypothetical protein